MTYQRVNLLQYGIDIYESKHSEGDLVKEHHHDFHQLLYALDGEGKIMLDGTVFDVKQDYGVLITPYTNHSVFSDSKLTLLVLTFSKDTLDSAVHNQLLQLFFSQSKFIASHPFGSSELRQLLRKMIFEQSQNRPVNFLAMCIYLSEILLVFARSGQASQLSDANSWRAERLRNYIDTHYYEIVDSKDLSSKLGISTRHMDNIFKEKYRVTPVHYLAEVRMGLAKKMLSETDKEISSICFEVGFESLSSFYRTFKNFTQVSPNTYRKMNTHVNLPHDDAAFI